MSACHCVFLTFYILSVGYSFFLNKKDKIISLEVGVFEGQKALVQFKARDFCCSTQFICESDVSIILSLMESIPVAWRNLSPSGKEVEASILLTEGSFC